jgi:hypothetical protein
MRGGSCPYLVRCSDDRYYVIKARNNPQGKRILANELLASLLLRQLGVPTPEPAIVTLSSFLTRVTEDMVIRFSTHMERWKDGLVFGSQIGNFGWDQIPEIPMFDFLPTDILLSTSNLSCFLDALVFDLWSCHHDSRQAVFAKPSEANTYSAVIIDNGACFGGANWDLTCRPLRTLYHQRVVYDRVFGMSSFYPMIERMRSLINPELLLGFAAEIPPDWYDEDRHALRSLVEVLAKRLGQLESAIEALRGSKFNPFIYWHETTESRPRLTFSAAPL